MRELPLRQTPARLEIFDKVLRLLDRRKDGLVNLLLVGGLGFGESLLGLGLATLEELCLGGARALRGGLCKVRVVDFIVDLNAKKIK